jgi:hypothetical protein
MNKKIIPLLIICLLLLGSIAFGQKSPVSVDPLTGTGNAVIPLYAISNGQVAVPVNLVYSGNGVKVKDVEGTAGMGWNIQIGGQVSRIVRGLPDDVTADNGTNSLSGWMSSSNAAANAIAGFTIQNDGSTCSKEIADIAYINANFPVTSDTEPDIFYVNAPGLSCQLVYDRGTATFQPVNYQDLTITYIVNPATGSQPNQINSFIITNDKGVKYTFGAGGASSTEIVTEKTFGSTPVYFTNKYNQYKNGITYYDSWGLTSITDANGNSVTLQYNTYPARSSTDSVNLYVNGSTTQSFQYKIQKTVTPMNLAFLSTSNQFSSSYQSLIFSYITLNGGGETGQTVVSTIEGFGKNFQFTYSPVSFTPTGYTRNFLRNVTDMGCSTPVNYNFNYYGETLSGSNYTTPLPDSASFKVDYWGYYASNTNTSLMPKAIINPSNATYQRYAIYQPAAFTGSYTFASVGNSRVADATNIIAGSLSKISYVQGGSTNIIYEPNNYLDVPSNVVVQGSGIRVKQITDSIGSGSANNIIRNYSYLNPSGGSSGRPITLPAYAFTTPYSGSATGQALWNAATVLSAHDLSADDHTVVYGYSKVSETGAGSTQYQYFIPATNWDSNAVPDCTGCTTPVWNPTINYVAREDCGLTYGPVKNDIYSYPFITNPNFDFERGLIKSVASYNDSGSEVSESDYTYVQTYPALSLTGLKYDDNPSSNPSVKTYNKYPVYYRTGELTASVTKKIYDSSNLGTAQTSTVNYAYNSTHHKLLTQQTVTNSDNSVVTTNFSYVKDYTVSTGSNPYILALFYLQLENVNAPVETYQEITRSGTTLITGGSLTLFLLGLSAGFNILPAQQLKFVQPAGIPVSSFNPYTVNAATQTATYDSRYYFPVANFDQYDYTGFPETVDDANRHVQTTILDHYTNRPTAVFKNVKYNEIAFSDFDTQEVPPLNYFTISGTDSYIPVGSHAGNAAGFASNQTATSATLTRDSVAKNYIFSIWINAVTPGTLTLTLTGISTHPTISYSGGWKYYELKIPVSTLSASYAVSFTSSQSISVDDILYYPDIAEVSTATYDPTTLAKIAQTNTNGVSEYYSNDQWGRMLFTYDQDKNIVAKNTYITPADIKNFNANIAYTPASGATTATLVGFGAGSNCNIAGNTYSWAFGDGNTQTVTGFNTVNHSYAAAGTYTVSVTITSPLFGTKTGTTSVTILPLTSTRVHYANTCSTGGHIPSAISSVTFSQGGSPRYTFTTAQLIAGQTIAPGSYAIVITPIGTLYNGSTNPTGYSAVTYRGATPHCFPYTGSTFSLSDDLSNTPDVFFQIQPVACP